MASRGDGRERAYPAGVVRLHGDDDGGGRSAAPGRDVRVARAGRVPARRPERGGCDGPPAVVRTGPDGLSADAGRTAPADRGVRPGPRAVRCPARPAGGPVAGGPAGRGLRGRRPVRQPRARDGRHPADAGRRGAAGRAGRRRPRGDVPQRGPGGAAAARALLGRGGARRGRRGVALVPARGLRLSAAPAGRRPGPAVGMGPGLRRGAAFIGRPDGGRTGARPGAYGPAHRGGGAGRRARRSGGAAGHGRRAPGRGGRFGQGGRRGHDLRGESAGLAPEQPEPAGEPGGDDVPHRFLEPAGPLSAHPRPRPVHRQ